MCVHVCVSVFEKNWIRNEIEEYKEGLDEVINARDDVKECTVREAFASQHIDDNNVSATMAT